MLGGIGMFDWLKIRQITMEVHNIDGRTHRCEMQSWTVDDATLVFKGNSGAGGVNFHSGGTTPGI